jgi:hypothetical protein
MSNGLFTPPINASLSPADNTLSDPLHSNKSIFLIPGHIYDFLIARRMNIMEIVNYSSASKLLSQIDLVHLAELNYGFMYRSQGHTLASVTFCVNTPVLKYFQNENEKNNCDLMVNRERMNKDSSFVKNIYDRLKNHKTTQTIPYKFIATKLGMAVVIYDGFLTHVENKTLEKKFIKAYLENSETFFKPEETVSFPIYGLYIKSFALN